MRLPEAADLAGSLQKYIASNYTAEETAVSTTNTHALLELAGGMI